MAAKSWPQTAAATKLATPMRGTVYSVSKTMVRPMRPPRHSQVGMRARPLAFGSPLQKRESKSKAAKATAKPSVAACRELPA